MRREEFPGMKKQPAAERKARMADVARLAGVGTMTVSRLLSGGTSVNEVASERIRWAIEKLDYRPNEVARALRARKARTIGVIVPHLEDPFFATCCYAIDEVAKGFGYSVIVTSSNSQQSIEEAEAQKMVLRHVEGIVIIPTKASASYLLRPEFADIPVVTLDRPTEEGGIDAVLVQNKIGTRVGVEHLIAHGHARISFIGIRRELYTMSARYQGYRQAMTSAHLKPEAYLDYTKSDSMVDAVRELLSRRDAPTAVFSGSNRVTRNILLALRELKVRVPNDLALVCFDDLDMADLWDPPPTTVRQPVRDLGRVAADLIFKRMKENSKAEKGERIMLPVELIVRNSCGCHLSENAGLPPEIESHPIGTLDKAKRGNNVGSQASRL
jgi:LacI family transcriptional regulator